MVERKTVIITGAASGIGKATMERFSNDPKYCPIYAADKDPGIHTLFQAGKHPNIIPLQIDVKSREQIISMLQKAVNDSGRVDVIVNAAGVMSKGRTSTYRNKDGTPTDASKEMEEVNVEAPFFIMTRLSEIISNKDAVVINLSSSKYLFPDVYHAEYQRGKRFLSRITKGVARAGFGKEKNIRFVDVQPGNTRTPIDSHGGWTEDSSKTEITAVQNITDWWREHFGNDPKNVADVVFRIAEGDIKKNTVLVGLDAKIGRILYLLTYPLAGYRFDILFFGGSFAVYKLAEFKERLRKK